MPPDPLPRSRERGRTSLALVPGPSGRVGRGIYRAAGKKRTAAGSGSPRRFVVIHRVQFRTFALAVQTVVRCARWRWCEGAACTRFSLGGHLLPMKYSTGEATKID